jgi:ABC-type branched-subunit amino acid transport system substrate-binding protein
MRRLPPLLAALVPLLAALAAPAPPTTAQVAPLRVGVVLPLSGRYAVAGQSNLVGMKLVIDTANAGGGLKSLGGARVELVVADNASVPVSSAAEARRLIETERVAFILGPYSTPEAEATVPVTERAGVGLLSTQASFDGLFERGYRYFTSVSMTSSQFGRSYADFLKWLNRAQGANIKTLAITYPDNDYGQTAAKATQQELGAAGISIVEVRSFPPTAQDLTPIVLRLKQTNPDAIVSIGYFQDGVLLHNSRVAQAYTDPPIWIGGSASFTDDRLWTTLGDRIARPALSGRTYGLAQFDNAARTPGVKWLAAAARRQKPDAIVDQAMAAGAQAAWILIEALERTGATQREELAAAVKKVRLPASSERVTMPQFSTGVAFEPSGRPQGPVALFVHWKDGAKEIVYPEALKTAEIKLR